MLHAREASVNTTLSGTGALLMGAGLAVLLLKGEALSANPAVILLQVAAIALMVWARVTFGRRSFHATAGVTRGELVTSGPYRSIRHPIYTSVCLFAWASVLGHPSFLSVALASAVSAGAAIRIVLEERALFQRYPEYAAYAATTRRVVPFIY
jgi:protein-S-isoprenylcysteine O-methyltransferase Ste14